MPEYFDSTSSKPKKTKKRRYQSGRTVNPRAAGQARRKPLQQAPRAPMGPPAMLSKPGQVALQPPGGWAAGGEVETETDAYGKYTIARGSGAARPQKFRSNG